MGEGQGKILLGFFLGTFVLASVLWLTWELQASRVKVDWIGTLLAGDLGPAIKGGGAGRGRLAEALSRHRDRMEVERIVLFGSGGEKLAESNPASHAPGRAENRGVLASDRASIRDAETGGEIGQLVVWRRVEMGRAFLVGFLAALIATYVASRWVRHGSIRRERA